MKKIFLLGFLILYASIKLICQDLIYIGNQEPVPCRILEWNSSFIRYMPEESNNSRVIVLAARQVDSIRFMDGKTQLFYSKSLQPLPFSGQKDYHMLGMDILSFISGNVRLSYEYLPASGLIGYYVPLTIRINSPQSYWYKENSLGLGIKIYLPLGIDRINYATGLSLIGGMYRDSYYSYPEDIAKDFGFLNFNFSNHISYEVSTNFLIAVSMDLKLFSPYRAEYSDEYTTRHKEQDYIPYFHIELIVR